jgi:hypothetical protein
MPDDDTDPASPGRPERALRRAAGLRRDARQLLADAGAQRAVRPGRRIAPAVLTATARVLRWRAARIEATWTPAGARRAAGRWQYTAIALCAAGMAGPWLGWPSPAYVALYLAAVVVFGWRCDRDGWADGYEAAQRAAFAGRSASTR